jgi:beta-glucosidase
MTQTRFPEGFLWGASTAGHQVEGGNVSADLWPLEWAEGSVFKEPSGDACDHYHRYPEDLALLAELGCNAYRFSLEWSRIEPEPGYVSRAALDHYRRMIEACLAVGLTPVVTAHHFTLPRWVAAKGGWSSADSPKQFGEFVARAARHLGDLMSWVCTLNEPNLIAMLGATGVLAMGANDDAINEPAVVTPSTEPDGLGDQPGTAHNWGVGGFDPSRYQMGLITGDLETMSAAHRLAREALRSEVPKVKVGWTLALVDLQAVEGGEEGCEQARKIGQTEWLAVSADDDFVGVQTYSRNLIGPRGKVPPPEGAAITQTGWEVYPEALGHTVRLAAEHAGVPILVTENGMATDDDEARIAYTRGALEGLAGCVADGIDVRGYLHWTLLDNFEWTAGFAKTFGLIAFDPITFARTVKPSARWLGQVAARNGLD